MVPFNTHHVHGSTSIPAAKRPRSRWSSSPFGQMLAGAGMAVSGGQEANELCECVVDCYQLA